MKKIEFLVLHTFFTILGFLIVSCSNDNPMNPDEPYQFDSARYEWRFDTLHGDYITELVVIDSNNLFLADNYNLIQYDGNNYVFHYTGDNNFGGHSISGLTKNNIYVAGAIYESNFFMKPALKKWNGISFELKNVPEIETISDFISANFVKSENEIWLGTYRGKIFKYDGNSSFEYFRPVDTSYTIVGITDINNQIFAVASNIVNDSTGTTAFGFRKFMKYNNNSWEIVFTQQYVEGNFISSVITKDAIFGIKEKGNIYMFNQNTYNEILSVDQFELLTGAMIAGNIEYNNLSVGNHYTLFNWNGSKWSIEFGGSPSPKFIWKLLLLNEKYYCLYYDRNISSEYYILAFGSKKNNF